MEKHDPHSLIQPTGQPPPSHGTSQPDAAREALRESEVALRQSETKLRNLLEHLPDLILVIDRQAQIRFSNAKSPDATPERLVGSTGFDHLAPESRLRARELVSQAFATGEVQWIEVRTVYDKWWDCRLVPLGDDEVMLICAEITARKQAEARVADEQHLLRRLFVIQEQERKLISHDIHDGLLQDVIGAHMLLEAAKASWQRQGIAIPAEFDSVAEILDRAMTEGRRMISRLRPMIIDELGLVDAIEYLVAQERQTGGVEIRFHRSGLHKPIHVILESSLFRIVQEAVTNIKRHSQSPTAEIDLTATENHLILEIRDHGVGFDTRCVSNDRFGIRGIVERARLFGGEGTITSQPGQGTCVHVEMPLNDYLGETTEDRQEQ